jgi:hypothetical protein
MEQLANCQAYLTSWDAGFLATRRKMKPVQLYCDLYFGLNAPWETLIIDDYHATHYKARTRDPVGVYPVWSARSQGWKSLIDLIKNPWGNSKRVISELLETSERPVRDQKHMVIISNLPSATNHSGFYEDLQEVQKQYPEVVLFLHGSYSFRYMFGLNLKAVDFEPRTPAASGSIHLPSGGKIYPAQAGSRTFWLDLLGYTKSELSKYPARRCEYNIRSAVWAGRYYKSLIKFNPSGQIKNPALEDYIKKNHLVFTERVVPKPGDKVVCDDCSLWLSCKYFREGAVCVVEDSEYKQLADLFGSRDSGNIIKGLSNLIGLNVQRAELAAEAEKHTRLSPELTKLMSDVFKQGIELLKIVDPQYRASPGRVNISVNGSGARAEITGNDASRQLASNAILALEQRGIPRDKITEDMLREFLMEQMGKGPIQIEGQVAP